MEQRLAKVSHWMRRENVDVTWVVSTENVYYLTGCYIVPHERLFGLFAFADQDPMLLCPTMEVEKVRLAGWRDAIISYDDRESPWQLIQESLQRRDPTGIRTMAVEKEQLTLARAEQLHAYMPQTQFTSVDEPLRQFRLLKQKSEIAVLQEAASLADEAIREALKSIRENCSEMEIVAEIEFAMKKRGIQEMAFQTVVLFGEKTAFPHGVATTNNRLSTGNLILIDLGIRVAGYCSDITRTFVYRTITEKQREIYEVVRQAQQAACEKCQPQMPIKQLDLAAQQEIKEAGYGEYILHRTGHGIGLGIHEAPFIHENNQELLQSGMVITIEPGIYVPGVGGVRIEDDIWITDHGHQLLTRFPTELQILQ